MVYDFARLIETLEYILGELERWRILREYELGVRVEDDPDGHDPYVVPRVEK